MVHMFYGVESKAERLSIPLHSVDKGVVDRNLQKLDINKYVIIGKNSKSTWKPVMAILVFS